MRHCVAFLVLLIFIDVSSSDPPTVECPVLTTMVNPHNHKYRGYPPYPCVKCSYGFSSVRLCEQGSKCEKFKDFYAEEEYFCVQVDQEKHTWTDMVPLNQNFPYKLPTTGPNPKIEKPVLTQLSWAPCPGQLTPFPTSGGLFIDLTATECKALSVYKTPPARFTASKA
ncbi:uncharacterized protein LOC129002363 [Macrosteles quadrilineatus]|uniref:uncharacterized protein LOC129002363 n=1 Tax=Macrosteles quadrilineatus TaxID=74068 RepID=UPI0023E23F9E|nr:uncharacterized protein LOC129002363 [Macrosteles quadrilineatus]